MKRKKYKKPYRRGERIVGSHSQRYGYKAITGTARVGSQRFKIINPRFKVNFQRVPLKQVTEGQKAIEVGLFESPTRIPKYLAPTKKTISNIQDIELKKERIRLKSQERRAQVILNDVLKKERDKETKLADRIAQRYESNAETESEYILRMAKERGAGLDNQIQRQSNAVKTQIQEMRNNLKREQAENKAYIDQLNAVKLQSKIENEKVLRLAQRELAMQAQKMQGVFKRAQREELAKKVMLTEIKTAKAYLEARIRYALDKKQNILLQKEMIKFNTALERLRPLGITTNIAPLNLSKNIAPPKLTSFGNSLNPQELGQMINDFNIKLKKSELAQLGLG